MNVTPKYIHEKGRPSKKILLVLIAAIPIIFWILFNAFVLLMLALDLGVFHRKTHEVSLKEALTWTLIWVFLALVFNAIIFYWRLPL